MYFDLVHENPMKSRLSTDMNIKALTLTHSLGWTVNCVLITSFVTTANNITKKKIVEFYLELGIFWTCTTFFNRFGQVFLRVFLIKFVILYEKLLWFSPGRFFLRFCFKHIASISKNLFQWFWLFLRMRAFINCFHKRGNLITTAL